MFRTSHLCILVLFTALLFFACAEAHAIGSSSFENAAVATRALSRGNAATANPEDPSTIAFNPAGLTQLGDRQSYLGSNFILTRYDFEGAEGIEDGSGSRTVIPVPFAYFSTPIIEDRLALGIGANSPFGLITKYSSDGPFRHIAYYNELTTSAYHVSLGYQLTDQLSVGGGWTHLEIGQKQVGKFNRALAAATPNDAVYEYDVEGDGQGWNAGLLYHLTEDDTIGAFYRSEVRTHLKGLMNTHDLAGGMAVAFGNVGNSSNITSADTDITMPACVTLGWNHRFNEKFDFGVDVTWTGWDSYDSIHTVFGTSNPILAGFETVNRDFKDVFSVYTGGSYVVNDSWRLNMGYFWKDMAANSLNYTNEIPDGDHHAFTAGFEHRINESWTLDFCYLADISTEQDISNNSGSGNLSNIDGKYSGLLQLWSFGLRLDF